MKILRGFLAVICLVCGVFALALWGASTAVVKTVEDGTVVTGIAQKMVEQPAVQAVITEKTQAYVTASLSDAGVDIASLGLQGTLDDAVAAAVASPQFQASLTDAIDGARADFANQLTSPAFAGEPLVVNLDVSAVINQTIASIPVVGSLVPAMTLDPLPVPVADANAFGKVRSGYSVIHFLRNWAGWIALALVVAGIALMPRKRWLLPLGLLFAGLGAAFLWIAVRWLTVDRIAGRLPGGREGDLGGALERFAHQDSLDRFGHRIFLIAAACLIGAVASFIIVKAATGSARKRAAIAAGEARAQARWADPAVTAGVNAAPVAVAPAGTAAAGTAAAGTAPAGTAPAVAAAAPAGTAPTGTPVADAEGTVASVPGATGTSPSGVSPAGTDHPRGQHQEGTPGHAR